MENDFSNPQPFDARHAWQASRRNLPHWRQDGVIYFITFRLDDSLPAEILNRWRREREDWLKHNPPPHTPAQHRQDVLLWDHRINQWLDAGHGSCRLTSPEAAECVEHALRHFDGGRYHLGDYVVMPNHVHVLAAPHVEWELSTILHSWKSFTAHAINRDQGRTGGLWQDESFDHIVRDDASWGKFSRYIRNNPRHVPPGHARLGYGSLLPP